LANGSQAGVDAMDKVQEALDESFLCREPAKLDSQAG
jgi:hypothetical protein